jgi:hypothetical protein
MAANRIMSGGAARRALPVLAAAVLAAAALGGCGGGGGSTATTATDKEADAEVLNEILARQEAAVRTYEVSFPALHERSNLAAARVFRAQEQAHVDATLKALRGLDANPEPEAEVISAAGLDTEAEFLTFLYELESATIQAEVTAIARLTEPAPRTMLTATVANQAQHLAFLRRALGIGPLQAIPTPFESGTTPVPTVAAR